MTATDTFLNIHAAIEALDTRAPQHRASARAMRHSVRSMPWLESGACAGDKAYDTLCTLLPHVMRSSISAFCKHHDLPAPREPTFLERALAADALDADDRQRCTAAWLYLQALRQRDCTSGTLARASIGLVRCALNSAGTLVHAALIQRSLSFWAGCAVAFYAYAKLDDWTARVQSSFYTALAALALRGYVAFPHAHRSTIGKIEMAIGRNGACEEAARNAIRALDATRDLAQLVRVVLAKE